MFDTHNHLAAKDIYPISDTFIQFAKSLEIEHFFVCAAELDDFVRLGTLEAKYPNEITAFFGVQPFFINDMANDWLDKLAKFLLSSPKRGIGETGLHKKTNKSVSLNNISDFALQQTVFAEHIVLARELHRPMAIHSVKAEAEVLSALKSSAGDFSFMMHSFNSSPDFAKQFVSLGGYISFSPRLMRKNDDKITSLVKSVPKDKLLIETDFSYGSDVVAVFDEFVKLADKIALLLNMNYKDFSNLINSNAEEFLNGKRRFS